MKKTQAFLVLIFAVVGLIARADDVAKVQAPTNQTSVKPDSEVGDSTLWLNPDYVTKRLAFKADSREEIHRRTAIQNDIASAVHAEGFDQIQNLTGLNLHCSNYANLDAHHRQIYWTNLFLKVALLKSDGKEHFIDTSKHYPEAKREIGLFQLTMADMGIAKSVEKDTNAPCSDIHGERDLLDASKNVNCFVRMEKNFLAGPNSLDKVTSYNNAKAFDLRLGLRYGLDKINVALQKTAECIVHRN